MSHDHALKDDVGFLKRLAAQGRGEPAPLAWLLALFGLVYGTVFLGPFVPFFLERAHVIDRPLAQTLMRQVGQMLFVAGNAIFVVGLLAAVSQMWATRRRRLRVNAVALAAWLGSLLAMVTACVSFWLILRFFLHSYKLVPQSADSSNGVMAAVVAMTVAMPVTVLVLYGLAWWVAAAVTGRKWLFLVAIGSFAAAVMMAVIPPLVVFIGALALLVLAFVPGLILALSARRKGVAT